MLGYSFLSLQTGKEAAAPMMVGGGENAVDESPARAKREGAHLSSRGPSSLFSQVGGKEILGSFYRVHASRKASLVCLS